MPTCISRSTALKVGLVILCALASSGAQAFDLVVQDLETHAAVPSFTFLVNEDNTSQPFLDAFDPDPELRPPSTAPMASHSPVVAAGDQDAASVALPPGRYLVSVRAPGYKLWGKHITLPDDDGVVAIELKPAPLPDSKIEVFVFEDWAIPNGFPDYPAEAEGADMSGFHILVGDGTGETIVDWYGEPLCGTGACITNSEGRVTIEGLPYGKWELKAIPPGVGWHQTTTFEGTRTIDAWIEEGSDGLGSPGALLQEPGAQTAFFFGFVHEDARDTLGGGPGTITGTARNLVTFPPFEELSFGEPVYRPWIVVTDLASDSQVLVERGNTDGSFSLSAPPGQYQLMIFDDLLQYINAFYTVNVPEGGGVVSPGSDPDCATPGTDCSVGLFRWFGWNSGHVFLDSNNNGIFESGDYGIPGLEVVAKFRDGSAYQGAITDGSGYYEMNEIRNPLGKMFNLEVDFGRFGLTGHSVHDEQYANYAQPDPNPTPVSPDVGGGLILSQSTFEGKRSIVDWGKRLYHGDGNGGVSGIVFYATTRNEFDASLSAVEDYEPGIPGVEVRLLHPGPDGLPFGDCPLCGVVDDDILVNRIFTDSWQMPALYNPDNPVACDVRDETGAALTDATPQFIADNCTEVPSLGNETKPGAYDGGWAFGEICDPAGGGYDLVNERCFSYPWVSPLPVGDYIVQVIPPPFYQIVREEDNNTGEGVEITPQIPPPPCVGAMHLVPPVPDFPDFPYTGLNMPLCDKRLVTLEAQQNPGLDIMLMTTDQPYVLNQPDSSWTSAQVVPPPGRFMGLVEDDINLNLDPNSLTYGEKKGVPGLPIGIYESGHSDPTPDPTDPAVGRLLTTVHTDQDGFWEVLLPSTYTANTPIPGGVSPAMYIMVVNDPGPDPSNPNPGFRSNYLTEPVIRDVWPGKMTPADTPVDPASALACSVPPDAPQIFRVSSPLATAGLVTNLTITGTHFGNTLDEFDDPIPPTVLLDDDDGVDDPVELDVVAYTPASPFDGSPVFEDVVEVQVPADFPAGPAQLTVISGPITGFVQPPGGGSVAVEGGGLPSRNGLTVHVVGGGYPAGSIASVSPPGTAGTPAIQPAIDAAGDGDLILVEPGTYRENVILHKNVKLQGYGPGGVVGAGNLEPQGFPCPDLTCPPPTLPGEEPWAHIPGSVIDGRFFTFSPGKKAEWLATLAGIAFDGPTPLPSGAAITAVFTSGETGAAGAPAADAPQIDGLGITTGRGEASGGVYVHAYGANLIVSNNILESNTGTHGGALSLGQPKSRGGLDDHENDHVRIHHNRFLANGGIFYAGGVGIFAGAEGYEFDHNDLCGNFSAEYGGGLSHWGLSPGGEIHDNRFYYNDAVDEGGGVMIAGDESNPPVGCSQPLSDACTLGRGSGAVLFERNLVQANLSNDDGGGLRLLNPLEDPITILNNFLVNNVATDHGGGVAMDNASDVTFVNNTVVGNVSTHTAEDAALGEAHGAGLTVDTHAPGFTPTDGSTFSDPVLFNNIFWDNLAYRWDVLTGEETGLGLVATAYIDLEVYGGGAGDCLDVTYSFLGGAQADFTGAPCPPGVGNIVGDGGAPPAPPAPDPNLRGNLTADGLGIQVTPGRFTPGQLVPFLGRPEGTLVGYTDYHLQVGLPGSPAIDVGTAGPVSGFLPPDDDIDGDVRPQGGGFDMGADETIGAPAAGVLNFAQAEATVLEGAGAVTLTVTRTGGSAGAISVAYRTQTLGGAQPGTDYEHSEGTLDWADGEAVSKSFAVPIVDDTFPEPSGPKVFFGVIENPTGGAITGPHSPVDVQVAIADDDGFASLPRRCGLLGIEPVVLLLLTGALRRMRRKS